MERIEIETLLEDRLGQVAPVRSLLPAKTDSFQLGIGEFEHGVRRNVAYGDGKFINTSFRRCKRDLLFKDDVQQSRESERAIPQRRRAVIQMDRCQMRISGGQRSARLPERSFAERWWNSVFTHFALPIA
jgi:hypothetical protein